MIHLDHRDSRPIYEQIADAFRRQIASGILQPGDKLPSVRELSAQLTINPNTIQRAYRELENGGCICSLPGKGSFVAKGPAATDLDALWHKFDAAARALTSRGVTAAELIEYIRQTGGADHA